MRNLLTVSFPPSWFHCSRAMVSPSLLLKWIVSDCNISFVTPVYIFVKPNLERKCYFKSARMVLSQVDSFLGVGKEAVRYSLCGFFADAGLSHNSNTLSPRSILGS